MRDNIKIVQDRASFDADHDKHPCTLNYGKKVLLHALSNSKTLFMCKCAKLASCYC